MSWCMLSVHGLPAMLHPLQIPASAHSSQHQRAWLQVVYGIAPGKYNANATGASTYYMQVTSPHHLFVMVLLTLAMIAVQN